MHLLSVQMGSVHMTCGQHHNTNIYTVDATFSTQYYQEYTGDALLCTLVVSKVNTKYMLKQRPDH